MKYLFAFSILSLVMSAFAQNQIQIKQIESDEQVILRYDSVKNTLWSISIPLEFEVTYKDDLSKNRWIFDGSQYVPEEFDKLHAYGGHGGWAGAWLQLKIDGKYRSPYTLKDQKQQDTCYYWVGTVHNIQPDSDIQDSLAVYVQKIRELKVESLPIGTLREFKIRYPQLVHRLLKSDSIKFNILESPFKYVESISIPVKY